MRLVGVLVGTHGWPRLNERNHRALLVHQGLELLVELATCGIVRCRAGFGAESFDLRSSAGKPARALANQLAGQERLVVVGVREVRRPARAAEPVLGAAVVRRRDRAGLAG